MIRLFLSLALSALGAVAAFAGCGADPEPCEIDSGAFHLRLPETPQNAPLLIFLHGHGGRANATIQNARVTDAFIARGWAVAAPQGTASRPDGPANWNWRDTPGRRDEAAFLGAISENLRQRFGISTTRVLLAGFSAGGFMTTTLACEAPESFAAYAPVSGGFWRPHPERCAGPVKLFHTHGWTDPVVPLEGRWLGGGRVAQGDIWHGLDLLRQASSCNALMPDTMGETSGFLRRRWTSCALGADIEMALWAGGHTVPEGWAEMVIEWFDETVPGDCPVTRLATDAATPLTETC